VRELLRAVLFVGLMGLLLVNVWVAMVLVSMSWVLHHL